ncbi:MAG TPA: hypothetical protein VFP46_01270 [Candidatus Paceibacterota bacterium]|nr:hypothetical protein [Candidatus Paceibacterota bacterium]
MYRNQFSALWYYEQWVQSVMTGVIVCRNLVDGLLNLPLRVTYHAPPADGD